MPILRNFLAVVLGFIAGGLVNMSLVKLGPSVFPPPKGIDMTTVEGIKAGLPLLQPEHFLFPWLAHAAGTFVGAFLAAKLAASHQWLTGGIVGGCTLLGGIAAAFMIPAPTWFLVADLGLAYVPMTLLAIWLAKPRSAPTTAA